MKKRGILTLKKMEEIFKDVKDIPQTTEILVSPKVYESFEKWWNSYTWYEKLWIKIQVKLEDLTRSLTRNS